MDSYRFYRHYVDMLDGNVSAALMLSFAVYKQVNLEHSGRMDGSGFWKYTREDWFRTTGLSNREQETCRSILKRKEFWSEKLCGIPAVMNYRVNFDALKLAENGLK
jgi:hypothetical protein